MNKTNSFTRWAGRCVLAAAFAFAAPASADTAYSELIVVGASYTSAGNFHLATGGAVAAPPYYDGRFSNGPVWVDVLAQRLGLPVPGPSLAGGTNYGWGSAESGDGVSIFGMPNVGQQIDQLLADRGGFDGDELIVVSGASGDLFWRPPYSPAVIVDNLVGHVRRLAAAGGVAFVVPNVSPLGNTPFVSGTPSEVRSDTLTEQANRQLARALDRLSEELEVTIYPVDMGGLTSAMLAVPEAFGLWNTSEPACPLCGTGRPEPGASDSVVSDPDRYLWWDFVHPSRVYHERLGEMTAEVIAAAGQ